MSWKKIPLSFLISASALAASTSLSVEFVVKDDTKLNSSANYTYGTEVGGAVETSDGILAATWVNGVLETHAPVGAMSSILKGTDGVYRVGVATIQQGTAESPYVSTSAGLWKGPVFTTLRSNWATSSDVFSISNGKVYGYQYAVVPTGTPITAQALLDNFNKYRDSPELDAASAAIGTGVSVEFIQRGGYWSIADKAWHDLTPTAQYEGKDVIGSVIAGSYAGFSKGGTFGLTTGNITYGAIILKTKDSYDAKGVFTGTEYEPRSAIWDTTTDQLLWVSTQRGLLTSAAKYHLTGNQNGQALDNRSQFLGAGTSGVSVIGTVELTMNGTTTAWDPIQGKVVAVPVAIPNVLEGIAAYRRDINYATSPLTSPDLSGTGRTFIRWQGDAYNVTDNVETGVIFTPADYISYTKRRLFSKRKVTRQLSYNAASNINVSYGSSSRTYDTLNITDAALAGMDETYIAARNVHYLYRDPTKPWNQQVQEATFSTQATLRRYTNFHLESIALDGDSRVISGTVYDNKNKRQIATTWSYNKTYQFGQGSLTDLSGSTDTPAGDTWSSTVLNLDAGTILTLNKDTSTQAITGVGSIHLQGHTLTLTGDNLSDYDYAGEIVDGGIPNGGIVKDGAKTQVLTGRVNIQGNVTVNNGVLLIDSESVFQPDVSYRGTDGALIAITDLSTIPDNAIYGGSGIDLTINTGGTIEFNVLASQVKTLNGTGVIVLNGANLIVSSGTYSGSIIDGDTIGGTITKTTSGTLSLLGDLSYTGVLNILEGKLILGGTLGNNITLKVATGAKVLVGDTPLVLNGTGTLSPTGSGVTVVGGTFGGTITNTEDATPVTLTKEGDGNLTLTGTNSYTGTTLVTGGTLTIGADNTTNGTDITLSKGNPSAPDTTLDLGGKTTTTNTLTTGVGTGIVSNGGTILVGSGSISGGVLEGSTGGGTIIKTGAGTLDITGSNTSTVGLSNTGGTLNLGNGATNTTTNLTTTAGTTTNFTTGGTIGTLGGGGTITTGGDLVIGGGTYAGTISDGTSPGSVTKTGGGTLVLGGTNNYTGGTTVNGGTLQADATSLPGGKVTINDGTLDLGDANITIGTLNGAGGALNTNGKVTIGNGSYAGGFTGGGTVEKNTNDTLYLGGSSPNYGGTILISNGGINYTGGGVLTNGTVTITNGTTLTTGTNTVVGAIDNAGVLVHTNGNLTTTTLTNTGSTTVEGNATITASTVTNAGTLNIATGGTLNAGVLTNDGAINTSGTLNVTNIFNTSTITTTGGKISIGGGTLAGTLIQESGATELVFTGDTAVTGTVGNTGVTSIVGAKVTGSVSRDSIITLSGGSLETTTSPIAALQGDVTSRFYIDNDLTLGTSTGTYNYLGAYTSLTLTKVGQSKQYLNGSNNITGTINVQEGLLGVETLTNNAIVSNGATLSILSKADGITVDTGATGILEIRGNTVLGTLTGTGTIYATKQANITLLDTVVNNTLAGDGTFYLANTRVTSNSANLTGTLVFSGTNTITGSLDRAIINIQSGANVDYTTTLTPITTVQIRPQSHPEYNRDLEVTNISNKLQGAGGILLNSALISGDSTAFTGTVQANTLVVTGNSAAHISSNALYLLQALTAAGTDSAVYTNTGDTSILLSHDYNYNSITTTNLNLFGTGTATIANLTAQVVNLHTGRTVLNSSNIGTIVLNDAQVVTPGTTATIRGNGGITINGDATLNNVQSTGTIAIDTTGHVTIATSTGGVNLVTGTYTLGDTEVIRIGGSATATINTTTTRTIDNGGQLTVDLDGGTLMNQTITGDGTLEFKGTVTIGQDISATNKTIITGRVITDTYTNNNTIVTGALSATDINMKATGNGVITGTNVTLSDSNLAGKITSTNLTLTNSTVTDATTTTLDIDTSTYAGDVKDVVSKGTTTIYGTNINSVVNSGDLTLNATTVGTFTGTAGAATITADSIGKVTVNGGTINLHVLNITESPVVNGTLVLTGTSVLDRPVLGDGLVLVDGDITLRDGRGMGGITVNTNGNLTIPDLTATPSNITLNGGTLSITGSGTLTPQVTGTGAVDFVGVTVTLQSPYNITGTVTLSASKLNLGTDPSIEYKSTNIVIDPFSELTGQGVIYGDVTNYGKLSPGNSPGIITFAGNYASSPLSQTIMEVAGVGAAGTPGGYDQIRYAKKYQLNGSLTVTLLGGYQPNGRSEYKLFSDITPSDGDTYTGVFSSITLPNSVLGRIEYRSNGIYYSSYNNLNEVTQVQQNLQAYAAALGNNTTAQQLLTLVGTPAFNSQLIANSPLGFTQAPSLVIRQNDSTFRDIQRHTQAQYKSKNTEEPNSFYVAADTLQSSYGSTIAKHSASGGHLGMEKTYTSGNYIGARIGYYAGTTTVAQWGSQDTNHISMTGYGSYELADNTFMYGTLGIGYDLYQVKHLHTTVTPRGYDVSTGIGIARMTKIDQWSLTPTVGLLCTRATVTSTSDGENKIDTMNTTSLKSIVGVDIDYSLRTSSYTTKLGLGLQLSKELLGTTAKLSGTTNNNAYTIEEDLYNSTAITINPNIAIGLPNFNTLRFGYTYTYDGTHTHLISTSYTKRF